MGPKALESGHPLTADRHDKWSRFLSAGSNVLTVPVVDHYEARMDLWPNQLHAIH